MKRITILALMIIFLTGQKSYAENNVNFSHPKELCSILENTGIKMSEYHYNDFDKYQCYSIKNIKLGKPNKFGIQNQIQISAYGSENKINNVKLILNSHNQLEEKKSLNKFIEIASVFLSVMGVNETQEILTKVANQDSSTITIDKYTIKFEFITGAVVNHYNIAVNRAQ